MSFSRSYLFVLIVFAIVVERPRSKAHGATDPAITRAVQYLRSRAGVEQAGESALIGLALIKADVPVSDGAVSACVNKVLARFSGGYLPERSGGADIYEAGCAAMLLANLEGESRKSAVEAVAQYLISKQKANGSWGYASSAAGDTSISQYAVLGLWEAENAGATIPPGVWDRAAQWYISSQTADGAWTYHPEEGGTPTVSTTAAGVGSLLICQRQLGRIRRPTEAPSKLLTPLTPEVTNGTFESQTKPTSFERAIKAGLGWLSNKYDPRSGIGIMGSSPYYGLYGMERVGALSKITKLGGREWEQLGRDYIHSTQGGDGSWTAAHGTSMNTAWATLFLTKSTEKTIRRITIQRLGAGTLLGGKGLPKDLESMTIAGGRVVSRPMSGAVEEMLSVLEGTKNEDPDSALAGLVARYETEGPKALRPYKDRFRKLITDSDPGLRRVAAWALARTGDLDVVPLLINALTDPDDGVVETARLGLQLLSRKIRGFGSSAPSTPEQREAEARQWRTWYSGIRPLDMEGQNEEDAAATARIGATGGVQ